MVAAGTVQGIHQGPDTHANRPAATAVAAGALYACSTHGLVYKSDGSTWANWITTPAAAAIYRPIEFVIGDGSGVIAAGTKGYVEVPFAWTDIARVTMLADVSGSIVVDVYKCTYSAFDPTTHPASGDKITASAPPTISSAKKSQDATLTGWTKTGTAGDVIAFVVTGSPATITRVTVSLVLAT